MTFSVFVNFDGNCREAVAFYAKAFGLDTPQFMTYGDAPEGEPSEADRDLIMYAELPIGNCNVMFMDFPTEYEYVKGNNIQLTASYRDLDDVRRVFEALKEGGQVITEPQKTFFSALYAMVTDRFGVQWHIMAGEEA